MSFDPKIGWALVLALAIEMAAGLFWTGQAAARLTAVEARMIEQQDAAVRLARVEAQLTDVRDSLARIESAPGSPGAAPMTAPLAVSGYASLFGAPDLGGDIVHRGAFAASLRARPGPLPLLVSHAPKAVAGAWTTAREDSRGLWVEGLVDPLLPAGPLALALIRRGLDGLSIGFTTRAARARPGGGRDLYVLELWEVSIVALPMAPRARLAARRPAAAPAL